MFFETIESGSKEYKASPTDKKVTSYVNVQLWSMPYLHFFLTCPVTKLSF